MIAHIRNLFSIGRPFGIGVIEVFVGGQRFQFLGLDIEQKQMGSRRGGEISVYIMFKVIAVKDDRTGRFRCVGIFFRITSVFVVLIHLNENSFSVRGPVVVINFFFHFRQLLRCSTATVQQPDLGLTFISIR